MAHGRLGILINTTMNINKENTRLWQILKSLRTTNDFIKHAKDIVETWNAGEAEHIGVNDIKTLMYHSLYIDELTFNNEEVENVENARAKLVQHWLDKTEWTPGNFWTELGGITEVMSEKLLVVQNMIVAKLTPWVVENREALENDFFSSPNYSGLRSFKGGVNSDFSIFVRLFTTKAAQAGLNLNWSDAFYSDLYSGEDMGYMQAAWSEFKLLPEQLKADFAIRSLKSGAYRHEYVTEDWIKSRTSIPRERLQLSSVASAYGYPVAISYVEKVSPKTAKQIQMGKELGLNPEEILGTLEVDALDMESLPAGLDSFDL